MRYSFFFAILFFLIAPLGTVAAQSNDPSTVAINWIRTQQQSDGSFPGFGPGDTADVTLAFVAAGIDPTSVKKADKSPIDYLQDQAASYSATGTGAAAKLLLAATAAGSDPRSFGGVDLVQQIATSYDAATGQYGKDMTGHCLALLAIRSVGASPPDAALARTEQLQLPDGGWSFDSTPATGSDTNTTALCGQALVASQRTGGATSKALTYLKTQQNADGGFPYSQTSQYGNGSDANSTALAIQALAAFGDDTSAAVKALASLQNGSGAFRFQTSQPDDNALATYQAVAGLLAKPLPLAVRTVDGAQAAFNGAKPVLPSTGGERNFMPLLITASLFVMVGILLGHLQRREAR